MIKKNLMVFSKYFTKLEMDKAAHLLDSEFGKVETYLCELIQDDLVVCKIDREKQILNFDFERQPRHIINEWVDNVNDLVGLVDFVVQKIEQEKVH